MSHSYPTTRVSQPASMYRSGFKHGKRARTDGQARLLRFGARLTARKADSRADRAYWLGFARGILA